MSKLSKEETARFSGAAWMLNYAKEHGIEAAEQELDRRGIRHMPLAVNKSDLQKFSDREKNNTIATMLLMTCATLHDEYGFGFDRMNRFIEDGMFHTLTIIKGTIKADKEIEND